MLPNGAQLPIDASHQETALNGMCTKDAAIVVCQSGVCDPSDNSCGLNTGSMCDSITGPSACRTGYCDPGTSLCAPKPLTPDGSSRLAGGGLLGCSFAGSRSNGSESLLGLLAMASLLLVRRVRRESVQRA